MRNLTTLLAIAFFFTIMIGCSGKQASKMKDNASSSINLPDTTKGVVPDTVVKTTQQADPSWEEALKNQKAIVTQPSMQNPPKGEIVLSPKGSGAPPMTITRLNDPNKSKELLDGLEKAKNGDMKGAIANFNDAISKNPRNYMAFFFRGKAKLELKRY